MFEYVPFTDRWGYARCILDNYLTASENRESFNLEGKPSVPTPLLKSAEGIGQNVYLNFVCFHKSTKFSTRSAVLPS